jgi:hypothetical protein
MKTIITALFLCATITVSTHALQEHLLIDVPAIQVEYGSLGWELCDLGSCTWVDAIKPIEFDNEDSFIGKPYRRKLWTCADKTRFLMTAEDGSKHCLALRNPQTVTN